VSQNC